MDDLEQALSKVQNPADICATDLVGIAVDEGSIFSILKSLRECTHKEERNCEVKKIVRISYVSNSGTEFDSEFSCLFSELKGALAKCGSPNQFAQFYQEIHHIQQQIIALATNPEERN